MGLFVITRLRRFVLLLLPPIFIDVIRLMRRSAYALGLPKSEGIAAAAPASKSTAPQSLRKYWGLNDLDRQVEKHINFDFGYYVELGANDGKLSSNTLYFEQNRNWRGILIEPAPNLYLKCRKNRSSDNFVVCAACVSFDYRDEFVKIIYSNSMSVSLNVETDIYDPAAHAETGRQFLRPSETIFSFGALARTLNSILLEANAPKVIDFLSLDVEGSELDVLKGVDHATFKFRYMLIECRDFDRLNSYIGQLHYRFIEKLNENDYLFALE